MMEVPLKRPSAQEKDEDVIQMQDEFLKMKVQPSAQVVKMDKKHNENLNAEKIIGNKGKDLVENKESSEDFKLNVPVMSDIKENEFPAGGNFSFRCGFNVSSSSSKSKGSSFIGNKKRQKSIFAQKMDQQSQSNIKSADSILNQSSEFPSESVIIDGSGLKTDDDHILEAQKIHHENIAKLSSMSKEEILKEQEELVQKLDPELVRFLKIRRKRQKSLESHSKTVTTSKLSKDEVTESNMRQQLVKNLQNKSSSLMKSKNAECSSGGSREKVLINEGYDHDAVILQAVTEENNESIDKHETHHVSEESSNNSRANNEEINLEELPIGPEEAKKWLHMDKVEKDKLAWMTFLPKPKPVDLKSGYTARFDFQGKLLPHDLDVPTQMGLHHHSNEPELPGYTVEELFLLARSSQQSQRVTALETLALILENYWQGLLDGCFEVPLLTTLLQAGIAPLLRWALDDTTVSSIAAAVWAVHSLLICKADEVCLDWSFPWLHGQLSPFLMAEDTEPITNPDELTDADIIKLDVIKGFLRMDILPRFRYILKVLCPPISVCKLIIEICARIACHSKESAKQVLEYPGFLNVIYEKFSPINWNYKEQCISIADSTFPLHSALKLIRIIASSHVELAVDLLSKYHLIDSLRCYLTIDPSDKKLPLKEVQSVIVETLKTWHVFLCYGLCTEIYLDLFSLILRQFQFCQSLSLINKVDENAQNYEYASHFLNALEAVVVVAAENEESKKSIVSLNTSLLLWEHVATLVQLAEICLKRWLWEFSTEVVTTKGLVLLSSCLNFISTFYENFFKVNSEEENLKTGKSLKNIVLSNLFPCLQSKYFTSLIGCLRSFSVLSMPYVSGCKRDAKVLTSLGSVLWKEDIIPALKEGTPFPFLLAVTNFLNTSNKLLNNTISQVVEFFLSAISSSDYLEKISSTYIKSYNWFDRFELHFLSLLIELNSQLIDGFRVCWYSVAVHVLTLLRSPYEFYIRMILQNTIFNYQYLLSLQISVSISHDKVKSLAEFYVSHFLLHEMQEQSRCTFQRKVDGLQSLSVPSNLKPLLEISWPYDPILYWYEENKGRKLSEMEPQMLLKKVTCCLEWIDIWENMENLFVNNVPSAAKFCYVCLIFLLDSDLFREQDIFSHLEKYLHKLVPRPPLDLAKFSWKNLPKFDDLYVELLNQYEAVSYGDVLFGNYILYPLQQCYLCHWKKSLFIEHPQVATFLNVPLGEMIMPLENYLEPKEQDADLILTYYRMLSSDKLTNKRCPVIFLMAVHHVHHFISSISEEQLKVQKILLRSLMQLKNQILKHCILLYKSPNQNSELGFDMCDSLPENLQLHLNNIYGKEIVL